MCAPLALGIATLAIGVAQAGVGFMQQQQQQQAAAAHARAQAKQQELQAQAYVDAANQSARATAIQYVEQNASERAREAMENARASRQLRENQKEALEKRATMLASTNAAGGTLQYLLAEYGRDEAQRADAIREQAEMNRRMHNINLNNAKLSAQNSLDQRQGYTYIQAGGGSSGNSNLWNTAGLALGVGGAALSATQNYYRAKKEWEGK